MARKQRDRELLKRELDSLRGTEDVESSEPPVREPPQQRRPPKQRRTVTRPQYSGGMRPGVVLLIIAIVFSLSIVIFFMGVQVNDLNEQNDDLQAQIDAFQPPPVTGQGFTVQYSREDAINAAFADDWVNSNVIGIAAQSASYGYDMRTFAVLAQRAEGIFWNVFIVGQACMDCDPMLFNVILALVNAQTGEVPQAHRATSMTEDVIKTTVWSNLTINFWP